MPDIVRVLVVDDSAYVRKVVTQMLGRSAFSDVAFVAVGLGLIYGATWLVDARPAGRRPLPVPVPARQASRP